MCHNRPREARHAIRSILAQSDLDFSLTISDNSSTDEVETLVKTEFPQVKFVRHRPMTPDHINCCVQAANSDYICVFHDDDVMSQDYVANMRLLMTRYPNAVAFGSNAKVEYFGKTNRLPSFLECGAEVLIKKPHELAARYFSRHQLGIAPFPSYVYKRSIALETPIEYLKGKYADVIWLLRLAFNGDIVWINKSLMTYRIHAESDGQQESRRDRLRLLCFLKSNIPWIGRDILDDYRCSFIYKPLVFKEKVANPARLHIAINFLRVYTWRRYIRFYTYKSAINRAWVKVNL